MIRFPSHRAIWAGLIAVGLSISAVAGEAPNNGLGLSWPNARDVSSSPHWHVYVFTSNGIRYIQINDLKGQVRGAFATAGGQFLVLPMGRDARHVATPEHAPSLSNTEVPMTSYAELIYKDASVQLSAVPLSDGSTMFTAMSSYSTLTTIACDPDKEDCNTHLN